MDHRQKILVIYSKLDDQPIDSSDKGWVSNFHKFFSSILTQIEHTELSIDLVDCKELISDNFADVVAVVSVLSENLIGDTKAVANINKWVKERKAEKSLNIDGISRFFKIHKSQFDTQSLPELADQIGYDFYYIDATTGRPQEFKRFFGAQAEKNYWMKMVDLAYDVGHVLHDISKKKVEKKQIERAKTIYLANTGKDLLVHRDVIKRELKRHGYEVLPKYSLPKEKEALEMSIKNDMAKCRISVHLIGEDYGERIEGSDLSLVDLQNQVAHEHTGIMITENAKTKDKKPFSRLIWLSPDIKNVTERQKIFIEDIKSEASVYEEAEVLQIQLEELKSIIIEEVESGGRFNTHRDVEGYEDPSEEDKTKSIYLIIDKEDQKDSRKVADYLKKEGYRVLLPVFEGELIDVRYIHQENLRRCDGSIIYFGNTTESWIKTKLQDLLKSPGFGRSKPMGVKAVYMDGNKEVDLDHFEKNKAMVLGNNGGFKPEHLKPFLTKLDN